METAGERVRAEVEVKEDDDLILNFSHRCVRQGGEAVAGGDKEGRR